MGINSKHKTPKWPIHQRFSALCNEGEITRCNGRVSADCSIPRWDDSQTLTTLRPRQNGRQFPDDIFKCIFLNENTWIYIKISLKFVPKSPINNIPALVQIMAWRRSGDKPLSESMMVSLLTHICVTRPQWVTWKLQWLLVLTISFFRKGSVRIYIYMA